MKPRAIIEPQNHTSFTSDIRTSVSNDIMVSLEHELA